MNERAILRRNALLNEWHTAAAHMQREQWKRLTPAERLQCGAELLVTARALMRAGILHQHPDWSEGQLQVEVLRRTLPHSLWKRFTTNRSTTMLDSSLAEALKATISLIEQQGIQYAVVGGLASTTWGEPRLTQDADIIIALQTGQIEALWKSACSDFYIDPLEALYDSVQQGMMFNLVHYGTGIKIDCYPQGQTKAAQEQLRQARKLMLGGIEVVMISPEWLIITKLRWYQITPSDKQWRDVRGVLDAQAQTIDWEYITRWAGELGVADELARVRQGVDEQPPEGRQQSLF